MDLKNQGWWFSLPMNKTLKANFQSEIHSFNKCYKDNNMPNFYFGCMGHCLFKTYSLKTLDEFGMMDKCALPCILDEDFEDEKVKAKYIIKKQQDRKDYNAINIRLLENLNK